MITLEVPYASPTTTMTIKNPELDDARVVDNQSRVKFSMGGDFYAFKKGPIEKLEWTFANLTKIKAEELEDFLVTAADQDIKITDYDGHIWQVKCITPELNFTTTGMGNGSLARHEALGISLEFEGVKIS